MIFVRLSSIILSPCTHTISSFGSCSSWQTSIVLPKEDIFSAWLKLFGTIGFAGGSLFQKKRRADFSALLSYSAFVSGHLIPEAIKDHRELGAGGCSSGVQRPCAGAAHDAVATDHCRVPLRTPPRCRHPDRRSDRPAGVGIIPQFRKAVQQGHQLLRVTAAPGLVPSEMPLSMAQVRASAMLAGDCPLSRAGSSTPAGG